MFSDKDCQQKPSNETFTEELSELKQQGASVLVVGSVRPEHQRAATSRLLGHATDRTRRRVLVSTTGDGDDRSIGHESALADTLRIVRYENQTRNAAVQEPASNPHTEPSIDNETDDGTATATTLADLGIELSSAVNAFETDIGGFEPSELRVGVTSLLPLLDDYSTEQVFKFIHLTNGRVTDVGGMVHYQLPVERDADIVPVLEPLFDVIVELREQNGTVQERWSLPKSGHCSGWLSLSET